MANKFHSLILFGNIVQTLAEVQEHIVFFHQGGIIEHVTHVPGPVSQSGAESWYNVVFNVGIYLARFRMLIHDFLTKIRI